MNPNHTYINVENALADSNSILYTYRKLIDLRKKHQVMVYGDYHPVMEEYQNVVAYTREYNGEKWLMVFNVQPFMQTIQFPDHFDMSKCDLIMCNYASISNIMQLRPYEGRIYDITSCSKSERRLKKYVCSVCGYVYDEASGTPFDELPDDYRCPMCRQGKEKFIAAE